MLPWEAKARTLNAPVDDVVPLLELLYHEAEVANGTAGMGPDDVYYDLDNDVDMDCLTCNPYRYGKVNG